MRPRCARRKRAGHDRSPPGGADRASATRTCARRATAAAFAPSTSASTPAPPSSRRTRRTCTRPTSGHRRGRAPRPSARTDKRKIIILGGGPNRIGQGIEFDYCCVHAVMALREEGFETIMVNCNPETVSTDYDTSDRLYFEPLTLEDVLDIVDVEKPEGVIVQFGGQTPLRAGGAAGSRPACAPRHQRRRHRSRRRPRALRRADGEARPARAALGHRAQRRGGGRRSPSASASR